jgi:uncharacterized damage-inducible protein DinB
MSEKSTAEVWLRGPVADCPAELMPAVHSLMQVREELLAVLPTLTAEQISSRPGGAASIRFHVVHMAGSLDRLLTYARGESLSDAQRVALAAEERVDLSVESSALVQMAARAIDRALEQIRATPVATLTERREVGRARLPSTVLGLLFHAAEHAQRHAGQIATTAKVVRQTPTEKT